MSKLHNDHLFDYYVINLDSSVLRWQNIQAHLQQYDIVPTRVSAVYAAALPAKIIDQYYTSTLNKAQFFMPLKPAEIGCFMSHLQVLKEFLKHSDKPYAVILEDDIEFIDNPAVYQKQWLSAVQSAKPVLLKLYARRKVTGRKLYHNKTMQTVLPRLVPLGTQAAVFNRAAAEQMLSSWHEFGMPVDVAYQHWWQHGVEVMVTVPNHIIEISEQLGGSNISNAKSGSFWYKAQRECKRSWYRMLLSIKSRCYYWLRY